MTRIFSIVGNPVLHSKSPQMHNAAFNEKNIDAVYTRLAAESAEQALEIAKEIGMEGMNVTTPFKEDMTKLVEMDETAKKVGAVNTVLMKDGKVLGTNTDVNGVMGALNKKLDGKKAIVLGGGGAARAAAVALIVLGAKVTVVNRTAEKAKAIANALGCSHAELSDMEEEIPGTDVLVSTISTGNRVIQPRFLEKNMIVLDANYAIESQLLKDAKNTGCRTIDGKEWLLHQGVKAFELFTGETAPLAVMRSAIETKTKKKTNIALVGMMGTGKTALAESLAKQTSRRIVDTDREIEKIAGGRVQEIFRKYGEKEFRKLEREEIKKLGEVKDSIIACGGGVVVDPKNATVLRENSTVVWLWANPETIGKRVSGQTRPLLNVNDRGNAIEQILEERKGLYAKASDLIVPTNQASPEQISKRVLNEKMHDGDPKPQAVNRRGF
ncbi:Shikimate dehydrogenase (NADP(+)) [Candidatus Bilamarchaeum dharawalense]|uniref:Shikimate dehydrogenase (NADP(+)) n=1 Tax=Candidatus Bilamarchaeum dharawalense TaxID=2885759 RepID=A0A5E4LPA4_9ARCH|nr:Shikimate dehydrogenase (NADP(+)) [Candidatus Bilamarchaeum dharawalense]